MKDRTAVIFCIGRELLEGAVLDRNANFMASQVNEVGIRVQTIQVLDAVEEEIVAAFRQAITSGVRFILVTGGMGPGHDDMTRESAAKAADVPLVVDEDAKSMLDRSYRRLLARGIVEDAELNEERLAMATIPKGASCFENAIGTAPSLKLDVDASTMFLMPGQPEELRRMFTEHVVPSIRSVGPIRYRETRSIEYPGGDESVISRMLADLGRRHTDVHARARLQGGERGQVTIRITLVADHTDEGDLAELLNAAEADLRARLGLEVKAEEAGGGGDRTAAE